jgi:hypothetical protein
VYLNGGLAVVGLFENQQGFAGTDEAYATRSEWPVHYALGTPTIDGSNEGKICRGYLALSGEPVICASKAATAVRKLSGMTLV